MRGILYCVRHTELLVKEVRRDQVPPRTVLPEEEVEGNGNDVNLMESAHISYSTKFYSLPLQIDTTAFPRSL